MSLHCVKEQNFHDQQLQIRRFDFESVKDVWHKSFGLAIYKNEGGTTQQKKKKRFFFLLLIQASILHPPSYLLTFLTTAKRRNSEVVVAYSYIIVRCVTKLFLCNKCQISHWFQSEFVNSCFIFFHYENRPRTYTYIRYYIGNNFAIFLTRIFKYQYTLTALGL